MDLGRWRRRCGKNLRVVTRQRLSLAPRVEIKLQQAAFNGAVEQLQLARRAQANLFGGIEIACEDPRRTAGEALLKRYGRSGCIARDDYERRVAAGGLYGPFNQTKLPPPPLTDVLYSLLLDGGAAEYSFEEWASNYGYDSDSRKAEATYNECRDIGRQLERMFTRDELAALREAFQDY